MLLIILTLELKPRVILNRCPEVLYLFKFVPTPPPEDEGISSDEELFDEVDSIIIIYKAPL